MNVRVIAIVIKFPKLLPLYKFLFDKSVQVIMSPEDATRFRVKTCRYARMDDLDSVICLVSY